jgi:putative heme-binding domain-containing protein
MPTIFNIRPLRQSLLCLLGVVACATFTRAQTTAAADDPMSDDPAVERRLLQLPDGFDIQLYASEPAIINPVTINFDAQGRLWALCLPGYPHVLPGQESRDFITVLDRATETGQAAGSHTFATGLSVPTGMIPGDGGVYVGQADSLLHLKDTDGDGKADQRRMLLSGFGTQDMHHTINTFRWGPDGFLYFNQGCYILSSVETPFGLRRQFGGAMWQLRTDSLALEIYDRSIFQSNTWGHVFDDWGHSIISSAWVADINLVLPDTPLNDSNDPAFAPPLPMTKLAGDRHSGLERITGRHFPPKWQGNLVSGGFQSQQVNRFAVEDNGERLSAKQLAPLIISKHRKFRPVDMKIGPDGALYIADWYNLIIQHNQVDFRDPRRDHERGRIWRITCKGRPLVVPPDLRAGTNAVLDHLKDAEQWTRDQARRILAERDQSEVATALAKWVKNVSENDPAAEHHLLEALWTYQTIDVVEPVLLRRMLRAKDARARSAATSVLGYWHDRVPDALALLTAQARDENIRVRLSAILAAQRIPSAASFEAAMNALDQRTDDMVDFELRKAALILQRYWYPEFQAGRLTLQNDPQKIAFALIAMHSAEANPKLLELFQAGKIKPEHQLELLTSVATTGDAQQIGAVLHAAVSSDALSVADRARLLDALSSAARDRKMVPSSDLESIAPLMARNDPMGLAAIRLTGAWKLESARKSLIQICEDPATSSSRRQSAMAALVDLGGAESHRHLSEWVGPDKPFAVRADAVVLLAGVDLKEAAVAAARLFHDPATGDPAPVFAAILHRKGGPAALADAMSDIKPRPEVARIGLREFATAGTTLTRLADVLRSAAEVSATHRQATPETLQRFAKLAMTQGDPARGEQLYRSSSLSCMRCHAIAGAGGNVGPDLAAIGTSAQPDFLVEHILQPGKHVKDGYTALAVDTQSGESFTGIQLRFSADVLVLRDATHDGIVIPRNKIKRQRPIGTLMPSGLADALSDADLANLVRFLSELGKPGPYSVGHAAVPRRWWTLVSFPPSLETADRGAMLLEDKRLVWSRQFTNVAGEVPVIEAAIGTDKSVAILRCAFDVRVPGQVNIAINDAAGAQVWLDGGAVQQTGRITKELKAGRHILDFWIDLSKRTTPGLRCELLEAPGSPAQAQWSPD